MCRERLLRRSAPRPPAYVACAAVNSPTVRSAKRVRPFFIRLPLCWLCASMAAARLENSLAARDRTAAPSRGGSRPACRAAPPAQERGGVADNARSCRRPARGVDISRARASSTSARARRHRAGATRGAVTRGTSRFAPPRGLQRPRRGQSAPAPRARRPRSPWPPPTLGRRRMRSRARARSPSRRPRKGSAARPRDVDAAIAADVGAGMSAEVERAEGVVRARRWELSDRRSIDYEFPVTENVQMMTRPRVQSNFLFS